MNSPLLPMGDSAPATARTLRAVLRPRLRIGPEDSLQRLIQFLRANGLQAVAITHEDRLQGTALLSDALECVNHPDPVEREKRLLSPVEAIAQPAEYRLKASASPDEALLLFRESGEAALPVADDEGNFYGMVLAADLLLPDLSPVYPTPVGGMATPFGVYLTSGSHRAGAGDLALVCTGMCMGGLMALSTALVYGGLWGIRMLFHLPYSPIYNVTFEPGKNQPLLGIESILLQLLIFVIFLLSIRKTSIAGFHAAEHQTVHAMERNETLAPDIVARMPRPHPRCGTNLLAAMVLFFTLLQVFQYLPPLDSLAPLLSLMVVLVTWRQFGAWMQERFTTRPARDKELLSGIDAGAKLTQLYLNSTPGRTTPFRRLWCMGLLQTMAGMLLAAGILQLILVIYAMSTHSPTFVLKLI